jgi:hypothetical protein
MRPERVVRGRHVCVQHKLFWQWHLVPAYVLTGPGGRAHTAAHKGAHARLRGTAAATCTGNVATGFFFDATATTLAGQIAVTTTCAPGLIGNATRLCVWNGPRSATGVWAAPVNNCQRTAALPACMLI